MESADPRPRLPSRWAGVTAKLPPALDQLAGPSDGVVELPVDRAWSGERRFDLADPVQRYLYHVTVLTSAVTREHYTEWLNASLLCGDWSRLRLPADGNCTTSAGMRQLSGDEQRPGLAEIRICDWYG